MRVYSNKMDEYSLFLPHFLTDTPQRATRTFHEQIAKKLQNFPIYNEK